MPLVSFFISLCLLTSTAFAGVHSLVADKSERFVAIGESNHDSSHGLDTLKRAIQEIADDDSFTRVFIEGVNENKEIYQKLSFDDKTKELLLGEEKELSILCHPLWINQVYHLFPLVRKINKSRKQAGLKPLVVVPIDSATREDLNSFEIEEVDQEHLKIDPECSSSPKTMFSDRFAYLHLASYAREEQTAKIFLNEVANIHSSERALIFYHQGHLLKNSLTCIPSKLQAGIVSIAPRPGSWVSLALANMQDEIYVSAIDHGPIKDPAPFGRTFYGLITHPKHFLNKLYQVFEKDPLILFDNVLDQTNQQFRWLSISELHPELKQACSALGKWK